MRKYSSSLHSGSKSKKKNQVIHERYVRQQNRRIKKLMDQLKQNPNEKPESGLDVDYDFYFQNNKGMFVVQAQMFHKQVFRKSSMKANIIQQMT